MIQVTFADQRMYITQPNARSVRALRPMDLLSAEIVDDPMYQSDIKYPAEAINRPLGVPRKNRILRMVTQWNEIIDIDIRQVTNQGTWLDERTGDDAVLAMVGPFIRKDPPAPAPGGGSGNVTGPLSSVDNELVLFDGVTGAAIKGSGRTLGDIVEDAPGMTGQSHIDSKVGGQTFLRGLVNGNGIEVQVVGSSLRVNVKFIAPNRIHISDGSGNTVEVPVATTTTADAVVRALATGKIDTSFLPDIVLGQVEYQGVWNASTNTPAIPVAAAGNKGDFYIVNVAVAAGHGHANIPNVDFALGDWIISSGTSWSKVDNTDAVTSVFGRIGAVVAAAGDYTASQVTNVPAGNIAAITVQAAINELDTEKEPAIAAGVSTQYWRGDKVWATLNAAAVGIVQATELVLGIGKVATQAIVEDSTTTNDTDFVTPKKWWQAWTQGLTLTAFANAVRALFAPTFLTYTGGSQAITSITFVDVASTTFNMTPGFWEVCFNVVHDSVNATTGAAFGVNGTAGFNFLSGVVTQNTPNTDRSSIHFNAYDYRSSTTAVLAVSNLPTSVLLTINVTSSGTLLLRCGSETGGAITITDVKGYMKHK